MKKRLLAMVNWLLPKSMRLVRVVDIREHARTLERLRTEAMERAQKAERLALDLGAETGRLEGENARLARQLAERPRPVIIPGETVENLRRPRRISHGMTGHFCPTCDKVVSVTQHGVVSCCTTCRSGVFNLEAVDVRQMIRDRHFWKAKYEALSREQQALHQRFDRLKVSNADVVERDAIMERLESLERENQHLREEAEAQEEKRKTAGSRAARSISI